MGRGLLRGLWPLHIVLWTRIASTIPPHVPPPGEWGAGSAGRGGPRAPRAPHPRLRLTVGPGLGAGRDPESFSAAPRSPVLAAGTGIFLKRRREVYLQGRGVPLAPLCEQERQCRPRASERARSPEREV
jgi:hypothetical protein